jgi:hypothetical protein
MVVTGGCLCRGVRYEISAAPISARACWCRLCQYLGAGTATVSAAFLKSTIIVSGKVSSYRSVADSGSIMHRTFCPVCGTPLFSEAESRSHLIFVRAGSLDDPELARPIATIWAAEAPTWACIDESIPQIDGQPPPVG